MASLPSVQALPDGQSLASGFPIDPCTDETCYIRTSGRVSAGIFSFSSDPCLYWSHYLIKHVSLKMQFPPHQHWGCSTLFQTCNGTIDLRLSPRLNAMAHAGHSSSCERSDVVRWTVRHTHKVIASGGITAERARWRNDRGNLHKHAHKRNHTLQGWNIINMFIVRFYAYLWCLLAGLINRWQLQQNCISEKYWHKTFTKYRCWGAILCDSSCTTQAGLWQHLHN